MVVQANRDANDRKAERERLALALVQDAMRGLRYGTVTIVLQDGFVVQVERNEKFRVAPQRPAGYREGDGI